MVIDPVVELLVTRGVRVTRAAYIAPAYTEDSPELDAESEAIIREALAQHRAGVEADQAGTAVAVTRRGDYEGRLRAPFFLRIGARGAELPGRAPRPIRF